MYFSVESSILDINLCNDHKHVSFQLHLYLEYSTFMMIENEMCARVSRALNFEQQKA